MWKRIVEDMWRGGGGESKREREGVRRGKREERYGGGRGGRGA